MGLFIAGFAYAGPTTETLGVRLARQSAVFKELALAELEASPETKAASGDFSQAAHLDDYSLAAIKRAARRDRLFRDRLARSATVGFPEEDRTSHDVMMYELDQRLADYRLKTFETPVSSRGGLFIDLAALTDALPLDSADRYRDYVGRLNDIPRVLSQTTAVMRKGRADGLTPPRSLISKLPDRCWAIVADDPFSVPADNISATLPRDQQIAIASHIRATVRERVLPAYRSFCAFLANDYVPHARSDVSERALPDGQRRYANLIRKATTTNLSADEIHAIGVREVARLDARLAEVAHQAGFPDLAAYRAALNHNPKYIPKSADQIVADFQRYVDLVKARLPQLFRDPPITRLVIEPMPPGGFPNITHHVDGANDGSTPGRILVAVSDFAHRTLISDETIAFHEGPPGHELQVSVQQRLKDLPTFRRELHFSAYVEGWADYSEGLGETLGLYRDPASEYGRLNTELTRALRLVADTGHARGWSRDQVVAFLRDSGAEDEPTLQAETDRIVAWPAQGLSYKIGQLKILELRDRAQAELGPSFDIRDFHAVILGGGSLPLPVLEARVDRWVSARRAERAQSGGSK